MYIAEAVIGPLQPTNALHTGCPKKVYLFGCVRGNKGYQYFQRFHCQTKDIHNCSEIRSPVHLQITFAKIIMKCTVEKIMD